MQYAEIQKQEYRLFTRNIFADLLKVVVDLGGLFCAHILYNCLKFCLAGVPLQQTLNLFTLGQIHGELWIN